MQRTVNTPSRAHIEPSNVLDDRLIVLLLSLLALGLRLPGLGGDLWIDEVATVENFVKLPLSKIVSTYHAANNHIFYSVLAHISIGLFGETERMLRLPALVFGVGTVAAFYYLARSVTCRSEAFAGSFLLAVSYHHAYFSQSARGYTGYLFFSVLSSALLIRALSGDRLRHWAGFVLTSVANVYMHLNGVFVLAAQAAGTLILAFLPIGRYAGDWPRLKHFFLSLVTAVLLTGMLYAPVVPSALMYFTTEYRDMGWSLSFAFLTVILRDVAPGLPGLATLAVALPISLTGVLSIARTTQLLVYITFLTPLLSLGLTAIFDFPIYPRFFLILLPFGIVFTVRGLRVITESLMSWLVRDTEPRLRVHSVFLVLVLVSAALAMAGLPRLYALPKQDYTGSLSFVRRERSPGDLVAAAYVTDTGARFYDPTVLSARTADDLERILSRRVPVWLLGTFIADMRMREPRLASIIDARFREVRRFPGVVGDGTIVVWKSVPVSADPSDAH